MTPKLHYALTRKGQLIHDEIVCQRHYELESQPGYSMGPLAPNEVERAGYKQTVTPYTGDHACEMCSEEAERSQVGNHQQLMERG